MADKQRASKLHAIVNICRGMHNKEPLLKTDRSIDDDDDDDEMCKQMSKSQCEYSEMDS